jgi:hypothetical protein
MKTLEDLLREAEARRIIEERNSALEENSNLPTEETPIPNGNTNNTRDINLPFYKNQDDISRFKSLRDIVKNRK